VNKGNEFGVLLADLWGDLQQPDILWQVGELLLCLVVAWFAGRYARRRQAATGAAWELGRRGMKRVAFPLVALALVASVRLVVRQWHHVNLLSVAMPLLASLAVIRMVFFVLHHSFRGAWLASFERVFATLAWAIVALHITGVLPDLIAALDSIYLSIGKQQLTLWLILQGMAAVLATLLVALWMGGVIEAKLMAAAGLDANLRVVFARLVKAVLIATAVLIGLPLVGIDLTTLSVFGGALGVGVGFGLQKIAANYISGFIILLDRSIRIGDSISVGADRGQVTKITTRYTVLKNNAGTESIVPNEMLMGTVVQNETLSDQRVRIALPVQIGYESDVERAMAIMVDSAQAQPRVLREPSPMAFVMAFADSGINLELGFWIEDPADGPQRLRSDINLAIWRGFQKEGIEIPFPQREVRVIGPEPAAQSLGQ
jgi:small-conductance mechanosensitive channel